MKFSSQKAFDRYLECRQFAAQKGIIHSLNKVFAQLLTWERYEDGEITKEIYIGTDFEEKSFTFSLRTKSGEYDICGGIIYHGCPEDGYCENGSVQLEPSYGWQIHT